jgi:hypothetical protein
MAAELLPRSQRRRRAGITAESFCIGTRNTMGADGTWHRVGVYGKDLYCLAAVTVTIWPAISVPHADPTSVMC